jgi:cysteine-rich repeat protein
MAAQLRWLAGLVAAAGAVAFVPFTGCGGSNGNGAPPTGDDAGDDDATTMDATAAVCGNGVVETGEDCDDGSKNGAPGDPCERDCTWACTPGTVNGDKKCNDGEPCNGTESCSAGHTCTPGTPLGDGTACGTGGDGGTGGICRSQVCSPAVCGDGFVTPPEECDDGSKNGAAGDGCNVSCMFVCVSTDPSRDCASTNPCVGAGTCDATTHVCTPGTTATDGTPCSPGGDAGTGDICKSGTCTSALCGDGKIEPPETCDPPNGTTCDGTCQTIACGDGKVGGVEQCDDGNVVNLDGCDSSCNFEQEQRATALKILGTTDSYCTVNALGHLALTSTGLSQIQPTIDTDVGNGTTNVMFKFTGSGSTPADLSGTSGAVALGPLSGHPDNADAGGYSGTSDLDWWYAVDPASIDANRNPLSTLPGTYTNKTLAAGPGRLTLALTLSGSPASLSMWNVDLRAAIGADAAIKTSTGLPPGHLASEHDVAGLTSYGTAGVGANGPAGELCGNITAQSLANVAVPMLVAKGGSAACTAGYVVGQNSLLDVVVGGCRVLIISAINATQPDQQDPTVTFPAGSKAPYKLSASSATTHVVDTCKDSSTPAQTVPLATCLSGMAYSSAFQFATDRVIVK